MAFPADDVAKFNQLLDQALADPQGKELIRFKLGVNKPPEQKVIDKAIEDKAYRRVDKFNGTAGSWQEWSFNFINATSAINKDVGMVLENIGKQSETKLTAETMLKLIT